MTIESNRTLGRIGAVLILIGIVSQIGSLFQYIFPHLTGFSLLFIGVAGVFGVLSFVGFLLYLISMYGFSKDYNEHRILSYLISGIVITIIAFVILAVIAVLIILFNFASLFPNLSSSTSSSQISSSFSKTFDYISPFFSLVGIIWIIYNVRAFNLLGDKSKVPLFRTGAKVLLAGALVNIVIAVILAVVGFYVSVSINTLLAFLTVGGFVQDFAWLLFAMAYLRIQVPAVALAPAFTLVNGPGQVKYCPICGAPNQTDAVYCTHCGQKL
ncbi:MAG: DUF996 domain-containing protein [Candidatus Bathyarchaeia archaeon]